MSILFFIHTFVLTTLDNTTFSIVDFLMVEGRYQIYPWVSYHSQNSSVHLERILILAKNCIDYMGCRMHLTYGYMNVHSS